MRWFEKLANYLESKGRSRIIMDREMNEPYLVRYYVMFKERPWWFPFNIVLHKVLRSDPDGLHNHPWMFWGSLILNGGYWERTKQGRKWKSPGCFRIRSGISFREFLRTITFNSSRKFTFSDDRRVASIVSKEITPDGDFHRLELDKEQANGQETWTLFLMGPKFKEWGFLRKNKNNPNENDWIQWEKYLEEKNK